MSFTDIDTRTEGERILAAWFNALKTAGEALETAIGFPTVPTSVTIANGQSVAANVTGASFDGSLYRSFVIEYYVYRNTTGGGATELVESGTIRSSYKTVAAAWSDPSTVREGDAGMTFTITSAGQLQYKSSLITGSAATSKMVFSARTSAV